MNKTKKRVGVETHNKRVIPQGQPSVTTPLEKIVLRALTKVTPLVQPRNIIDYKSANKSIWEKMIGKLPPRIFLEKKIANSWLSPRATRTKAKIHHPGKGVCLSSSVGRVGLPKISNDLNIEVTLWQLLRLPLPMRKKVKQRIGSSVLQKLNQPGNYKSVPPNGELNYYDIQHEADKDLSPTNLKVIPQDRQDETNDKRPPTHSESTLIPRETRAGVLKITQSELRIDPPREEWMEESDWQVSLGKSTKSEEAILAIFREFQSRKSEVKGANISKKGLCHQLIRFSGFTKAISNLRFSQTKIYFQVM
ncbi:hypothetical protein O6H91_10G056300 [Diphasiastrum complanatum]|uniref:Uncharacterized protein n=1 Tax=Diphasiastrum complanatum TaxID=34168 RepID=A0ACC2CH58_DIPCM|nr:hypothetical protein O6H91_10G056300 [Diphasiastrum complanatum]